MGRMGRKNKREKKNDSELSWVRCVKIVLNIQHGLQTFDFKGNKKQA